MNKKKQKTNHKTSSDKLLEFVVTTVNMLIPYFGLPALDFTYNIKNKIAKSKISNYGEVVFSIDYLKEYRQACINIYPEALYLFETNEYEMLTHGLLHELCHLLTIPLAEASKDRFITVREIDRASEELTESIAQIMKKFIKDSGFKPKINTK